MDDNELAAFVAKCATDTASKLDQQSERIRKLEAERDELREAMARGDLGTHDDLGTWAGVKRMDEQSALDRQEGGDHYKNMAIQPAEYIHRNGLGFIEGCVVKYVSRWRAKNGIKDLKKARHCIDMLIEMESRESKP